MSNIAGKSEAYSGFVFTSTYHTGNVPYDMTSGPVDTDVQ